MFSIDYVCPDHDGHGQGRRRGYKRRSRPDTHKNHKKPCHQSSSSQRGRRREIRSKDYKAILLDIMSSTSEESSETEESWTIPVTRKSISGLVSSLSAVARGTAGTSEPEVSRIARKSTGGVAKKSTGGILGVSLYRSRMKSRSPIRDAQEDSDDEKDRNEKPFVKAPEDETRQVQLSLVKCEDPCGTSKIIQQPSKAPEESRTDEDSDIELIEEIVQEDFEEASAKVPSPQVDTPIVTASEQILTQTDCPKAVTAPSSSSTAWLCAPPTTGSTSVQDRVQLPEAPSTAERSNHHPSHPNTALLNNVENWSPPPVTPADIVDPIGFIHSVDEENVTKYPQTTSSTSASSSLPIITSSQSLAEDSLNNSTLDLDSVRALGVPKSEPQEICLPESQVLTSTHQEFQEPEVVDLLSSDSDQ